MSDHGKGGDHHGLGAGAKTALAIAGAIFIGGLGIYIGSAGIGGRSLSSDPAPGFNQAHAGGGGRTIGSRWVDEHGRRCEMMPDKAPLCCATGNPTRTGPNSAGCR